MYRRRSPRRGDCPLALCCMAFGLGVLLALCGELRTDAPLAVKYHIAAENERFVRKDGVVYRCGEVYRTMVYRTMVDKTTGNVLSRELLRRNHARVLYDTAVLDLHDAPAGPSGT